MLGERGVNDVRTQVFRLVGKIAAPAGWTITPAFLWQRTAASDTNIFYPDIGLYDQDKRVAEPSADDLVLPEVECLADEHAEQITQWVRDGGNKIVSPKINPADAVAIGDVRGFDPRALMTHLTEGAAEACGGGPVVAVMTALKSLGATRFEVMEYATSGDVTGDRRSVVGYLSAVAF